jgi:hypothetical protein
MSGMLSECLFINYLPDIVGRFCRTVKGGYLVPIGETEVPVSVFHLPFEEKNGFFSFFRYFRLPIRSERERNTERERERERGLRGRRRDGERVETDIIYREKKSLR